jgi:poly-gamma-glutamate synthesis protein (capsule biosynthesis protein)
MTGRGIDQILPHPSNPILLEAWVQDARRYIALAEERHGPIPRRAGFDYVWGEALAELARRAPDLRIANLETAVTRSDRHWRGKGIHYRMHPGNVACLLALGLDCCVLANNHVLDWGYEGLAETLRTLRAAGLRTAGAGEDLRAAAAPAVLEVPGRGRVLVYAMGSTTAGVPGAWAAGPGQPGVHLPRGSAEKVTRRLRDLVHDTRRPGDLALASLHWGGNWGYEIPAWQRELAHALIEEAGMDLIHGHSSHHFKAIEVHRGRPILYGCGDFLNDYEGIGGHDGHRPELTLMYFPTFGPGGDLEGLRLVPLRVRRFRLERCAEEETAWVRQTLDREGRALGTAVSPAGDGSFSLRWRDRETANRP